MNYLNIFICTFLKPSFKHNRSTCSNYLSTLSSFDLYFFSFFSSFLFPIESSESESSTCLSLRSSVVRSYFRAFRGLIIVVLTFSQCSITIQKNLKLYKFHEKYQKPDACIDSLLFFILSRFFLRLTPQCTRDANHDCGNKNHS